MVVRRRCEVCSKPLNVWAGICTNGRCPSCHDDYCLPPRHLQIGHDRKPQCETQKFDGAGVYRCPNVAEYKVSEPAIPDSLPTYVCNLCANLVREFPEVYTVTPITG